MRTRLNPTGEPTAQRGQEPGGERLESILIGMQLVGPIARAEQALRVDQREVVGGSTRQTLEHAPEIHERIVNDRRTLSDVPAAVVERGLEPGARAGRMRAVRDGEIVAVAEDRNVRGITVAKDEQIGVRRLHHVERAFQPRRVKPGGAGHGKIQDRSGSHNQAYHLGPTWGPWRSRTGRYCQRRPRTSARVLRPCSPRKGSRSWSTHLAPLRTGRTREASCQTMRTPRSPHPSYNRSPRGRRRRSRP